MQKVTEQQLQIKIYNPRTFLAFFYEFGLFRDTITFAQ